MNYGFKCEGWTSNKKQKLAERLVKELGLATTWLESKGVKPYIEVDEMYNGVRIRRITNLSEEGQAELVHKADKIYTEMV